MPIDLTTIPLLKYLRERRESSVRLQDVVPNFRIFNRCNSRLPSKLNVRTTSAENIFQSRRFLDMGTYSRLALNVINDLYQKNPQVMDLELAAIKLHEEVIAKYKHCIHKSYCVEYPKLPVRTRAFYRELVRCTASYVDEAEGLNIRRFNRFEELEKCKLEIEAIKDGLEILKKIIEKNEQNKVLKEGELANYDAQIKKLELELKKLEDKRSSYICGIALDQPMPLPDGYNPGIYLEMLEKYLECKLSKIMFAAPHEPDRAGYKSGESFESKNGIPLIVETIEGHDNFDFELYSKQMKHLWSVYENAGKRLDYTFLPDKDKINTPLHQVTKLVFFPCIDRYIPVFEGIMEAKSSTGKFLQLIRSLDKSVTSDQVAFQIGPNHGAITTLLARMFGKVVAVDIQEKACENTELTLSLEPEDVRKKVEVHCDDMAYLLRHAKKHGKCSLLIFNNPIFRGKEEEDRDGQAGENFELAKRAIKLLPELLEKDGKAFFLVGIPEDEEGKRNLWTLRKLKDFMAEELPGWNIDIADDTRIEYDGHGKGRYAVVQISPPEKQNFVVKSLLCNRNRVEESHMFQHKLLLLREKSLS